MPHPNPLDSLFDDSAEVVVASTKKVPNVFPTITNVPYRLAIIGEAPGSDEVSQGKPFVGYSGKELDRFLSRFSILRDACFIGNVCQHQPQGNKIASFDWEGPQIQEGIKQLHEDLTTFNPNLILLLGASALNVFRGHILTPIRRRKSKDGYVFVFPDSIGDWRGSFFLSLPGSPLENVKCIASYHPAACLRNYEWTPLLMLDIQRASVEMTTKELHIPQRTLKVSQSFQDICIELDKVLEQATIVGTDIEGYWDFIRCISFATSPDYAFIVPFVDMNGHSLWSVDEEATLWKKVSQILASTRITKVWQNGLYDRFCLQYGFQVITQGLNEDIMLMHWELYCELEKNLGLQCSIYTNEPFYKSEIKSDTREDFWRYCCKDSAVTLEIHLKLQKWLQPSSRKHYEFNRDLLNALLFMEIRGIKYNELAAKQRLADVEHQIYELQHQLDTIAGTGIKTTDRVLLRAQLRDHMCYKRDSSQVKKGFEQDYDICMRILVGEGTLTASDKGRLAVALEKALNVKGPDLKKYLYETLKLPVQHDPQTKAVTSDYEALITLLKKSTHPSLPVIISITELRTRSQMLAIATDPDGRVRASYNEVGSETGRVTCGTSPTGSGYNLQTIPDENDIKPLEHPLRRGMRDLLVADNGCYLAKCDLKGADGWTVGANLAALGDSTMLDDLRFGLKPASILCYARRHGVQSITGKSRPELATLCQEVKKSDWDYFAYKQCIWGFCYLMGVRKACQHVFNLSEGAVVVTEEQMQQAKDMLFRRYNISLWHRAKERQLKNQPYPPSTVSPSGHIRKFFGRYTDVLGQALADEPQQVTTYATNMAMSNLWKDVENRNKDNGSLPLRIEPLHQVHDEMLTQFRIEDTPWAINKIKLWFANPIKIAGIEVTIPFEGSYGTDWAMDSKSKKGSI